MDENRICCTSDKKTGNLNQLIEKNNLTELEHQVGRFINMQKIAKKIALNNESGTIIEFGTYRGLGIILLDLAFELNASPKANKFNRYFVGVDNFSGLKINSNIWKKGQFNDTSIDFATQKILENTNIENNLELIKGNFNDAKVRKKLFSYRNVRIIHFDADLGISTKQALKLTEVFLKERSESIYFLFDDWGCHPEEVPDAFFDWYVHNKDKYKIEAKKFSSTKYTRYYEIKFL